MCERLFFSLFVSLLITYSVQANINVPISTTHNVEIDRVVSANEWSHANRLDVNNVMRPFNNVRAPVDTTVHFFEDGQNFYILFEAFDSSPERIQARLVDRDLIWGDDIVGIKIDTFND